MRRLRQNSFLRFNKVYPKPESTPTSDTPATPAAAPAVVFSACTSSLGTEILPALYVLPSVNVILIWQVSVPTIQPELDGHFAVLFDLAWRNRQAGCREIVVAFLPDCVKRHIFLGGAG